MSTKNEGSAAAGCGIVLGLLMLFVGVPVIWGMWDSGVFSNEKKVDYESAPVFGPKEAGQLVANLDTAARAQGVCYGWIIDSGRYRTIPKVTPSYPGTFSPRPEVAPSPTTAPTPTTTPTTRATPTRRSTLGAERRATSRPTRTAVPAPTPTYRSYTTEYEFDLKRLKETGVEYGSNLGVGVDPRERPQSCPKWVLLKADYSWSSLDDEWTSATLRATSNIGLDELNIASRMGFYSSDLVGDAGIARLADAVGGMPLLVADQGLARPLPEPPAKAVPAGDSLSGRGIGFYIFMTIAIGVIVGGVAWAGITGVRYWRGTI